ncbi:uncharacterized protein LOC108700640 [Xenopus laevis]|uniref:Glycosyltransferase family 92 protein n=2 Tax=Xenopus laevis TaxID=8355 RepID=A0A1L8F107_XENLA|nr:uncharacterized protein LOC108700640 [Xenopus laevis]XP_041430815.1 uncharacterized protein LOC108700640 [Xenopus laevis]OCT65262.1 hypothetical protein XELAEV_18041501mg [Xenopus laevis]
MLYGKRLGFFGCTVGIACLIFSFNFYWPKKFRSKISWRRIESCSGELPWDTITPLKGTKAYIIAPYYDNREKTIIRILGIVHHRDVKELYCYFCCTSDNILYTVRAEINIHSDRFGFPYGLADIICSEPPDCTPTHVSVHQSPSEEPDSLTTFKIRNRVRGRLTANFTVCFSAMFGNYSNVLQFIQTIEMYKILGAQKVTVYLNNCSRQMEEVLQYYSKEGTVEVIPWQIQRYLKVSHNWQYPKDDTEIGYYGQISALNDCIYRNMYSSKFVVLNDQDEIILPFKHWTWGSMMETLQQEKPNDGIFLFENHIFPQTVLSNGHFPNISSWNWVPGFNILQVIHREPDRFLYYNARKMIVDPRAVIQTSVHSTLKQYKYSNYVPLETALVYHCRGPLQPSLPRASLIEDKTIWKYNDSLIRNVNKMLKKFKLAR